MFQFCKVVGILGRFILLGLDKNEIIFFFNIIYLQFILYDDDDDDDKNQRNQDKGQGDEGVKIFF